MAYPQPFTARTKAEHGVVERARAGAQAASGHRTRHDRDGSFPEEGLEVLARSGFLALPIPMELGGEAAGVAACTLGIAELAKGDPSLALVTAWHLAMIGRLSEGRTWPEPLFGSVAAEISAAREGHGALINSLATEPEMGSPSRGGLPATRAERSGDGWCLNGLKSFATASAVLRWGVVSATVQEAENPTLASFLVPMRTPGLRIERTWDTLGMRATGSDTLHLEGVRLPESALLPRPGGSSAALLERAWGLVIASTYLGVAEAARDYAVEFARTRRPTALGGKSIAALSQIRHRTGQMDLHLFQARSQLLGTAWAWESAPPEGRAEMLGALLAAKVSVTNLAVQVADEAMRLVGGSSMDRTAPLEQFFRDVRGGLHHPPQDDAAREHLAKEALDIP